MNIGTWNLPLRGQNFLLTPTPKRLYIKANRLKDEVHLNLCLVSPLLSHHGSTINMAQTREIGFPGTSRPLLWR